MKASRSRLLVSTWLTRVLSPRFVIKLVSPSESPFVFSPLSVFYSSDHMDIKIKIESTVTYRLAFTQGSTSPDHRSPLHSTLLAHCSFDSQFTCIENSAGVPMTPTAPLQYKAVNAFTAVLHTATLVIKSALSFSCTSWKDGKEKHCCCSTLFWPEEESAFRCLYWCPRPPNVTSLTAPALWIPPH